MTLTAKMKRAIAEHIVHFSAKSFLEDIDSVGKAYDNKEVTYDDLTKFAEGLSELMLEAVPEPNEGQMTDEARAHHIETSGQDCCPYCKADTTEKVEFDDYSPVETGDVYQKAECMVCNRQWMDVFRLVEVHELCSRPEHFALCAGCDARLAQKDAIEREVEGNTVHYCKGCDQIHFSKGRELVSKPKKEEPT